VTRDDNSGPFAPDFVERRTNVFLYSSFDVTVRVGPNESSMRPKNATICSI
jgi:hypothetical protein